MFEGIKKWWGGISKDDKEWITKGGGIILAVACVLAYIAASIACFIGSASVIATALWTGGIVAFILGLFFGIFWLVASAGSQ